LERGDDFLPALAIVIFLGEIVFIEEAATSVLGRWENFYVIVGSSAGALTGLQFVVIALVAEAQVARSMLEIRAFGTPTVVHFCAALLISAIASAPWDSLTGIAIALGICGAAGVVYVFTVIRHARRQTGYKPEAVDWFWYVWFPLAAYVGLAWAALFLVRYAGIALFTVAGVTLLLLFAGIRNSWDSVTYIAIEHIGKDKKPAED